MQETQEMQVQSLGHLLQYSCLGNPRDRGAWWATVHGVTEWDTAEVAGNAQAHGLKQ